MTEMSDIAPDPTPTLADAHWTFARFIAPFTSRSRLVALHDSDADGVTAGVVWQRAFERMGFTTAIRVAPDRQRNAWTHDSRVRVAALYPDRLFILDLGSQSTPVLAGVPACFIDHHRPEGVPPDDTLISAYSWQPIPNTSLLVYDLFAAHVDISDLDWIAAIGTISDLGERAPFELLTSAKKKYTAKYLKEATTLINAARRASHYDPEAAAQALLAHPDPRALVNSVAPEVEQLRAARDEVKAALEEGKKAAPIFAGNVALVRLRSPCQIHPLIAQIWRTRLPKYIVIAANEGYLPGRVNFSARSASGINVLQFLRAIELPESEGQYGHGHDQASGGSLPFEHWNELLRQLGFPATAWVQRA